MPNFSSINHREAKPIRVSFTYSTKVLPVRFLINLLKETGLIFTSSETSESVILEE